MATINIADYKRPGIFINEIDDSVRSIPQTNQIINLVPGFSKKGPVNKPILITTPQQFITIFGDIDRNLEKKGSFFHRTVLNILSSAPVYALNLLKTDIDLDLIDFKAVSLASDVLNSNIKKIPYESIFDKSDFWDRDDETFLNAVYPLKDDDRQVMFMTNVSNKKASVFIYKASVEGYNETLDIFYGGLNKVPEYLNPKSQAKDYIVSMLIVQGDWTDYSNLSVDTRYSRYFNTKGLRKDQISNFKNDNTVTVLQNYTDLSIIPYFKDLNGRDVFIETVVNRDTDSHGIFITYDIDLVEAQEYETGLLDLIGSNLVSEETDIIDYLSYSETISENILFETVVLNRVSNAFGKMLEYDLKYDGVIVLNELSGAADGKEIQIAVDPLAIAGINYYNIENKKQTVDTTNNADKVFVPNSNIGKIRKDTVYLDDNGALGILQGFEVSNLTTWDNVPLKPVPSGVLPVAIVEIGSSSGDVDITNINYIPNMVWENSSILGDIQITYNGVNEVKVNFFNTKTVDDDTNYRITILNSIFADFQSKLKVGSSIIKDFDNIKRTITNIVYNTNGSFDKSFVITLAPSINITRTDLADLQIFFVDDEQTFTPIGSVSKGMRTNPEAPVLGEGYGTVSVNSKFYKAFENGLINTGDSFYPLLYSKVFGKVEFKNVLGNSTITLWYNTGDIDPTKLSDSRKIKVFGSQANDSIFTILNNGGEITGQIGSYNTKLDLIVNEAITTETVIDKITIAGASEGDKTYLKMYFMGSELYVDFTDKTSISTSLNFATKYSLDNIKVFSDISSYKQTLEIEDILDTNRVLINAARYSEVKIGDYLKAYIDEDTLRIGENPRRLTRIVDKRAYSSDPTLSVIKTDSPIDVISFGTDKQTFRYTTMEDYVLTYKAISLGGFKMREDSMPNGTETRQSDILDLLAPNTSIFKGLVNRNKLSWRYLVDSFGLGLTSNSKQQLVDLCGEKLTCLGFINMPSAKSFKKSTSPSFIDQTTKALNTEFIKLGGDPQSNPSFLYTFGQGKGQSNTAYFFPYVTISDNSRPLDVPPSSFVCNTFMRKHNSRLASIKPWTISAGIDNGLITGIGNVEIDLNPDDITNLNLMNANPIVYKLNRGFAIETDNSAQLSPRSSLSYIHCREVLINLENEMYEMLLTYQWKFNTAAIRAEIKGKADAIMDKYVRDNGLYAYQNVMDESNNTSEIIDAQIGVIDSYVEIIKGLSIIVNNISILRSGSISASGFAQ